MKRSLEYARERKAWTGFAFVSQWQLDEYCRVYWLPRDRTQVGRLFEGLDLVEPGLVRVPEWRPAMAIDAGAPAQMWAGVALKS